MIARSRVRRFQRIIWNYYRAHGRELSWRRTRDPYRIVVSEIMLQQTQVERVTAFYTRFVGKFPNFRVLAHAPVARVLRAWQGLGYNRRALYLKRIAQMVVSQHGGKLPCDPAVLRTFPGIGKTCAGSIAAFAFNAPVPFIETNIRRVYIHFFFSPAPQRYNRTFTRSRKVAIRGKVRDEEIMRLVEATMDRQNPREWFFALMDYGAMLGVREKENPNRRSAHYRRQSAFEGSVRQLRGKILRALVHGEAQTVAALSRALDIPHGKVALAVIALEREGFVVQSGITVILSGAPT